MMPHDMTYKIIAPLMSDPSACADWERRLALLGALDEEALDALTPTLKAFVLRRALEFTACEHKTPRTKKIVEAISHLIDELEPNGTTLALESRLFEELHRLRLSPPAVTDAGYAFDLIASIDQDVYLTSSPGNHKRARARRQQPVVGPHGMRLDGVRLLVVGGDIDNFSRALGEGLGADVTWLGSDAVGRARELASARFDVAVILTGFISHSLDYKRLFEAAHTLMCNTSCTWQSVVRQLARDLTPGELAALAAS